MTPDESDTQRLRAIFSDRAEEEAEAADEATEEHEAHTHERRSERAEYLKDKLAEQAESQQDDG